MWLVCPSDARSTAALQNEMSARCGTTAVTSIEKIVRAKLTGSTKGAPLLHRHRSPRWLPPWQMMINFGRASSGLRGLKPAQIQEDPVPILHTLRPPLPYGAP